MNDLFCGVVNKTERTFDRSVQYCLVCFCSEMRHTISLWERGLSTHPDLGQFEKLLEESNPLLEGKYRIEERSNQLATACGWTIAAVGCIQLMVMSIIAVKVKPWIRMSGVFHLVINIVSMIDLVLALASVMTALRAFQGKHSRCEEGRSPFYLAIVATSLLFVCWILSLLLAGFAARLRQEEYMQKQHVFLAAQIRSRPIEKASMRPSSSSLRKTIFGAIIVNSNEVDSNQTTLKFQESRSPVWLKILLGRS